VILPIALAIVLLASVATSRATHLGTDTEGHTTVEQTICGKDPATSACLPTSARDASAYYNLRLGPGQPYLARELDPSAPVAMSGRADRRRSLLYFGQLTDFQLADEESPARVEFLDPTSDQDPSQFAAAAWRPQEAMAPQMDDRAIHQINEFVPASPVPQGDGSRAQMKLAITTGDSIDNQQSNETSWVVKLLEGGAIDPNSGSSNPADYANCPPGTPGPGEAAKYTGVQDFNDYFEGADPDFYDPNDPRGAFSGWPRYPGLMDRAEVPFQAEGLHVPSYVTLGNHDGLVQGNAAANRSFEDVATGCLKMMGPNQQFTSLSEAIAQITPSFLSNLLAADPTKVSEVPPDPRRTFVSTAQYKALHEPPFANQADGHGFGFVDPQENAASNGSAAYYSWSPQPGFRFIALDTVGEGGVVSDRSSDGNIDDPQFHWLEQQLQAATTRNELIVLFGHHAINSLTNNEPDESAPPCTGTDDGHGHDQNPGCDNDPRISTPLHLGQPSQRPAGDTTETLSELLLRYPHVIAFVAGHSHVNQVLPYSRPNGGGGFWNIKTAAEADWPAQSRLIEIMDNRDGTLSIFGTTIDHSAPTSVPAAGTDAGNFDVDQLASLNREFAYNDPQKGGGTGEGTAADQNVELLVRDPRAGYARPKGATPLRASLVPAYEQCTNGNRQHGPPLAILSCNPPAQASSQLTVGTLDANGEAANSVGSARYDVVAGDASTPANEADVRLAVSITDVRRRLDLSDYTGELQAVTSLRMTDRYNADDSGTFFEPGTAQDLDFPATVPCTATANAQIGGTCAVSTTFNALLPGTVVEERRSNWQFGTVNVFDGGPDGVVSTDPNTLFATQGIFAP
jgi:hypothetical protein